MRSMLKAAAAIGAAAFILAACGGGDGGTTVTKPTPPAQTEHQKAIADIEKAIAAATTKEAVESAIADLPDATTRAEEKELTEKADAAKKALRAKDQLAALEKAAKEVDVNDLTGDKLAAAQEKIAALQAAYDAAEDVADTDKADYNKQLDTANTAVDRQEQMNALSAASGKLDMALAAFSGVTPTKDQLDEAMAALRELKAALTDAGDLSDTDKDRYQAQADRADADDGQIKTAQGHYRDHVIKNIEDTQIAAAMKAVEMVTDTSDEDTVTDAEDKIKAARNEIEGANVSEDQKKELLRKLAMHEGGLDRAKLSRDRAKAQRNADISKAMFFALSGPDRGTDGRGLGDNTALNNLGTEPTYERQTKLTPRHRQLLKLDLQGGSEGAGSLSDTDEHTPVYFLNEKVAGTEGEWKVVDLSGAVDGDGDSNSLFRDKVRMYRIFTPKTTPAKVLFADDGERGNLSAAGDYDPTTRVLKITAQVNRTMHFEGNALPTSGNKEFKPTQGNIFSVRGTYYGAPGIYQCTWASAGDCTVSNNAGGLSVTAANQWVFIHDEGAAIDDLEDGHGVYFGWWLRENAGDGLPRAATVFHGSWGSGAGAAAGVTANTGTATFVGDAVGLYSIRDPLNENYDGGEFKAKATLTAKFGEASSSPEVSRPGMSGRIDKFRLNGGDADPGWTVNLKHRDWEDYNRGVGISDEAKTSWSINGVESAYRGTWAANLYDTTVERSDTTKTAKGGNDNNSAPDLALGRFYAEHGRTHRVVGAFGAENTSKN